VIRYVRDKYGEENVAQIGTFGTMAARAVVRDVGRVLQVPLSRVDQIAKLIPAPPPPITLEDALGASAELKREYDTDPQVKELIDIGRRLEGLARQASTHAAGVVIADEPLVHYVPLQVVVPKGSQASRADRSALTTQWSMGDVERAGLLKMDFLGLRNLTILDKAVRLIERTRGEQIDPYRLPLDDPEAFALLQRGETKGVFQLESGGIRDLLQKLRPDSLRDIIATNALYRPGPLGGGMVEAYVNRKHGREKAEYMHPVLEEVLGETHGVMVYQEQVMRILNRLGGIELTDAYACIKAISKKKQALVDQYREQFVAGAQERGLARKQAEEIFGLITHFGGYGFNKSHSTAYALVAFQTAYLKAHYPVEFMAALLSSDIPGRNFNQKDRMVEHLEDCRRMEVTVRPPDVNVGEREFTVVDGEIAFALTAIKGVGAPVVLEIMHARDDGGPFADLFDFCERVDLKLVSNAQVETLIKSGAMDSLPGTRKWKLDQLEKAIQGGAQMQDDRRRGQRNFLLDMDEPAEQQTAALPPENYGDLPENERLRFEKELLGFYSSSHPLARHADALKTYASHTVAAVAELPAGADVLIGGIFGAIKYSNTRNSRSGNTRFAMFDLEDLTGAIRCILWPDDFVKQSALVAADAVCLVRGQVDRSREEPNLIVSELIPIERAPEVLSRGVVIRLRGGVHSEQDVENVAEVLRSQPGPCTVYFDVHCPAAPPQGPHARRVLLKSATERVAASPALLAQLERLLGPDHVRFLNGNANGR
jgi:DNA polymerase-3 subunit alpha